jgi:RNA polymerase sigma factor (sigma-70 family)
LHHHRQSELHPRQQATPAHRQAARSGSIGPFGELIADPLAEDEYERVITTIAIDQLRDLLSGLSDREREVLRARYGLDSPEESLRQIARRLGVSAERVRQVENRALGKLRAAAAESADAAHPCPRKPASSKPA